jgi:hypothetical protein
VKCSRCKIGKTAGSFAWKNKAKGKRYSICKQCHNTYTKDHYKANKASYKKRARSNNEKYKDRNTKFIREYLSTHPCVDCGEDDLIVLEFDHTDHRFKSGNISRLKQNSVSLKALKAEISKCEVRCANCHRRRTSKQFGWCI